MCIGLQAVYMQTVKMLLYLKKKKKNQNVKFILFYFLGLHSALLRLLATNYPHLCMVEDWISEEEVTGTLPLLRKMLLTSSSCKYSQTQLREGTRNSHYRPLS